VFSKLKRLKTDMTVGQETFNMLLLKSIENEVLRVIDFTELMNEFATIEASEHLFKMLEL
jgi:hypothetical protein